MSLQKISGSKKIPGKKGETRFQKQTDRYERSSKHTVLFFTAILLAILAVYAIIKTSGI